LHVFQCIGVVGLDICFINWQPQLLPWVGSILHNSMIRLRKASGLVVPLDVGFDNVILNISSVIMSTTSKR